MPKRARGLSAVALKALPPGRHADGGGLYAVVEAGGSRTWAFRYQRAGKRREMGLGSMEAVGLAAARQKARKAAETLAAGDDPIEARDAAQAARIAAGAAPAPVTFGQAVDAYLAQHAPTWRSDKTLAAWTNTLRGHAGPRLGGMPVAAVGRDDVLAVLAPIWRGNHETARKTRARVAAVLDFAMAKGWREEGLNPARWRGNLAPLLGGRPVDAAVRHYPALPWGEAPAFVAALRGRSAVAARMLEWVLLTVCRSNEARGARWREIDLERAVWTVPPARSKTGVEHRIPLAPAAVALARALLPAGGARPAPDALVFPGPGGGAHSVMAMAALLDRVQAGGPGGAPRWRDADGRPITVHGFRSTFRDWAGETTAHPREVVEAALAHRVGDRTERAYARGDVFARRARLMCDWADFLARSAADVRRLHPDPVAASGATSAAG